MVYATGGEAAEMMQELEGADVGHSVMGSLVCDGGSVDREAKKAEELLLSAETPLKSNEFFTGPSRNRSLRRNRGSALRLNASLWQRIRKPLKRKASFYGLVRYACKCKRGDQAAQDKIGKDFLAEQECCQEPYFVKKVCRKVGRDHKRFRERDLKDMMNWNANRAPCLCISALETQHALFNNLLQKRRWWHTQASEITTEQHLQRGRGVYPKRVKFIMSRRRGEKRRRGNINSARAGGKSSILKTERVVQKALREAKRKRQETSNTQRHSAFNECLKSERALALQRQPDRTWTRNE